MRIVSCILIKIFFLLILIFSGCQKDDYSDIEDYKSFNINSSYTGSEYNIHILYPENYDATLSYHIVYLLDADWYFREVSEIINTNYKNSVVLIGIGYKNKNKRTTDFTFPYDDMFQNSGGADNYIQFINNELILYVEEDLSILSSETTLVGHSLGGYFGLYFMLQQNFQNPFDNIISASPSLFWNDAYIFDLEEQYHSNNDTLSIDLYNSIGDLEGVTMNTLFDAFNERIENRGYEDLSFKYKRFENISHNNSPIISFENALYFILN